MFCLGAIVAMSSERWLQIRDWLRPRRSQLAALGLTLVIALLIGASLSHGRIGMLAREKLAVAGFAAFYLVSPILAPGESVFSDPTAPVAWIVGAVALIAVGALIFFLWRRLDDDRYLVSRCIAHRHAVADIRADRGQALSVSPVGRDVLDRRYRRR